MTEEIFIELKGGDDRMWKREEFWTICFHARGCNGRIGSNGVDCE